MVKKYNPVVSVRIPPAMLERIDKEIETGKYRNRPDYIMAALRLMEELNQAGVNMPSLKEGILKSIDESGKT